MREWKLKTSDPVHLTLASDARLVPTDYFNDQIWEIALKGGEPSGIALNTTFGLRARSFRMMPRFTENEITINDHDEFINTPLLNEFYPNYLSFSFCPFKNLNVKAEYWVPHSQGILVRFRLFNQSDKSREIKFDWLAQLSPHNGHILTPVEIENTWALTGDTDGLTLIILISGGARSFASPFPCFSQVIQLPSRYEYDITVSCAGFYTIQDSFTAARHYLGRNWEIETNKIKLLNTEQIDIFTGNSDWDAVFAFSQTLLNQLRINPKKLLPHPSFVLSRHKDQGYSVRGDGRDYNHLWNGQPAIESYFLASSLLPAAAEYAKGLVRNFISTQSEDGTIDWKPGVEGQRSQLLATPILSSLVWRIFQSTADQNFLNETFYPLYRFVKAWFSPVHDRNHDGIPEWDHVLQAGCEDHPVFSYSLPYSLGVDISTAESPALAAFLFKECWCLKEIGKIINQHDFDLELDSIADRLSEFVNATWNAEQNAYLYQDRDTHKSTKGQIIAKKQGNGEILIQRDFPEPVRLLIHTQVCDEKTRRGQFFIHGVDQQGMLDVERIDMHQMRWNHGKGFITGTCVYSRIESIDIQGVRDEDVISIFSVNYHFHDLTSFIPLWAGIPNREQAQSMIEKCLMDPLKYNRSFGLIQFLEQNVSDTENQELFTNLIWTQLIGEGMLRYGYRNEVAQLFNQMMPAIIRSLKNHHNFREYYQGVTGIGTGESNYLSGVAPISLFLDTIGCRLLSSNKIACRGFNPFSLPITVKYRGISVYKQVDKTTVIFPNGETALVEDDVPKIISCE